MISNRVSFIRTLAFTALFTISLGADSTHALPQLERIELFAINQIDGTPLPRTPVRVGREVREALTSSGRDLLALRPAQVAAGGRVFVYGAVPRDAGMEEFDTEALVWTEDRWIRRTIMPKAAGRLGYVSATVLVPDVEPDTVPTAVFRRSGSKLDPVTVVSVPVDVPRRARLRVSYALDEWDLADLSPVTVTVAAREVYGRVPDAKAYELFSETLIPSAIAKASGGEHGWSDQAVDLSRFSGTSVVIELSSSVRDAPGKLRPHVVWGPATIVGGSTATQRSSVVIVSLDGVRARSLSCCGSDRATSPFMDSLFGDGGVIFDLAVTQAVESVPAHMSLMTGLYPSVHGVRSADLSLAVGVDTLASRLSDHGYATAAVSAGTNLAAETGFGRGFQSFRELGDVNPWLVEGKTSAAISASLDWIEKHAGEPYFLFLHLTKATPPYIPARETLELFKDSRLDAPSSLDEGALVRYEREVRYLDDAMKNFVGRLDELSPAESTLLIVTSGHGQEFLEHGVREAGTQLFDESIRVPLLMRGAGLRKGQRYREIIGLIDVMPTVLEMTGVSLSPGMQGKSIAKALRSGLPYSLPPRFVEAHAPKRLALDIETSAWIPPAYAVVDSSHKVVMTTVGEGQKAFSAYDLFSDTAESTDLLAVDMEPPAWITELRGDVENYPTACAKVARKPGKNPNIPVRTRLSLELERAR
jgi:arylsulfatase A-like enzyme